METVLDGSADPMSASKRAADYVGAALQAVDELPVVFVQRRSRSWLGWITMPGSRHLTQLFVRRQLTVTLARLRSETALEETAKAGSSEEAGRLNALIDAVGPKSSAVVPVVIVLGTIGLVVSLLSILVPAFQQEARLLGSFPRLITLDGAAVAESATAFDEIPSAFSPIDLLGVLTALLLGAAVTWALFSVLAGSSHAASAILDDPWRYDRRAPFRRSVQRGPVPTQRKAFGVRPRRIHTPVAADLFRNAALYFIVIYFSLLLGALLNYAETDEQWIEYQRVGSAYMASLFVVALFPAGVLAAYLIIRHRHASDGTAQPPPRAWRAALGAAFAVFAGVMLIGAVTWTFGTRLTEGADLSVWSEDVYLDAGTVDRFDEIDNVEAQSLSLYPVAIVVPDGFVDADLLVTELATADDFIRIEIDDDAESRLSVVKAPLGAAAGETPEAWISAGLAARLDPTQGNTVSFPIGDDGDDDSFVARTSTVFTTPDPDATVIVIDRAAFPFGSDELLVDEVFLRAANGPLRDDSASMDAIDAVLNEYPSPAKNDLRQDVVLDDAGGVSFIVLTPLFVFAALAVAFGRPWRWGRAPAELADPALPPGSPLPEPEVASTASAGDGCDTCEPATTTQE